MREKHTQLIATNRPLGCDRFTPVVCHLMYGSVSASGVAGEGGGTRPPTLTIRGGPWCWWQVVRPLVLVDVQDAPAAAAHERLVAFKRRHYAQQCDWSGDGSAVLPFSLTEPKPNGCGVGLMLVVLLLVLVLLLMLVLVLVIVFALIVLICVLLRFFLFIV